MEEKFELELPDLMVQQKNVDDIPAKFFKKISHPLPYEAFIVDRDPNQKLFRHLLKFSNEATEDKRQLLIDKINSYFPANPTKEKAVVT